MSKTFYITTPIYYVNGNPHIGHAYTTTAADAITRYRRLCGQSAYFLTGTDEHGQKVLEAAQKRSMPPKDHCDDMVVKWKEMMAEMGIGYDRFMRTTDTDHIAVVQGALQRLHDAGQLYKEDYTGWYSTAAERFWTEKDLVDGKCPDTGQPVVEITETNWFFRMGSYQQRLIDHIEANPQFILPVSRRNEILGFLRKELGDLCISRPVARMSWGIPLPFDQDYVTYVWFDALLNYLTGAGYQPDGTFDDSNRWPADFQLLGKDILTTHSVYWITMLMALEVELPQTLYAHGWWIAGDGLKMSKSLGNTIEVGLLKDAFGLDATRYFLLKEIAFGADGRFTYDGFLSRYNVDLANDFGNLAHRGLSMTTMWLGGVVPERGELTDLDRELEALALKTVADVHEALQTLQFHVALDAVNQLVSAGNKYVDTTAPWALNKAGDLVRLATVKRMVLEVLNVTAALQLFAMPERCAELLARLGQPDPQAAFQAVRQATALDLLTAGTPVTTGDPLFPRFRELPEPLASMVAAAEPPAPAPKVSKKKSKEPAPLETITLADFQKVGLRTGKVLSAEPHPNATKLLVLQVDIGEPTPRQIVAGIADVFQPDAVVGRTVVVVVNLAPAQLRGVESQGMLLAAGTKSVVDLVSVNAPVGEVVR